MKKQELFNHFATDLVQKEGITEQLKTTDQMKWVQKMNNIQNQVSAIINIELIYVYSSNYPFVLTCSPFGGEVFAFYCRFEGGCKEKV